MSTSSAPTPVRADDFAFISEMLRRETSIVLDRSQEYLLPGRLSPLLREEHFATMGDLVRALHSPNAAALRSKVIDALTTNETLWFRDNNLFTALRANILPELIANRQRQRSLEIWCGACATGQEPYTLAMFLDREFPELNGWRLHILATDISVGALERAKAGEYNQMEMGRGLPAPYLIQYFERKGLNFRIADGIRRYVSFKQMNLAGTWPYLAQFDLILIRNVMIYFDNATRARIMENAAKQMKPDGSLILGASESLPVNPVNFRSQRAGTISWYQRPQN